MSTAARPDPQRAAASAEHLDGDDDGAVAPPPPAPAKAGTSSCEGLTPEGRTRLDHLENELDRLVRALATDSNSGSDGSDVDGLMGSRSRSSSEYDSDNDDETGTTNDNYVPNASDHTEPPRPQVGLLSSDLGGDDMMDAVEELLSSSAEAAASRNVSSTTTTTTTTAKFTLSGKKITFLTVTELHKEKRRLKRRLRELKRSGQKAADGTCNSHGDNADHYYDMYRAITEQIAVLEWRELTEQTGDDGRFVDTDDALRAASDNSAGSFAAAARAGITPRGKQQSDLIRIVEEDDECEADDGSGANANAFDDSDSDAGDDEDGGDDDSSGVDADTDSDDSYLFDFNDDLGHENGDGLVLDREDSDDHKHSILNVSSPLKVQGGEATSLFDEHFSSDLFSPFTSPPSPIKTSPSAVVESESPLMPRKLFDGSSGAASNTTGTTVSDTKCTDADSLSQEGSINGPPFDVCTMKNAAEKRPSSDADETGSTFITEDDTITHTSDLLDLYPCSKDEDDDPHSPDALLKKSWDPQIGGFHVATSPLNFDDGRQCLVGGTANMQPLPTCRPRVSGTAKFSLKNLASIARGAKKQGNDTTIDRETMKYLRGRTNTGSKKYSKVVEETDQTLLRDREHHQIGR